MWHKIVCLHRKKKRYLLFTYLVPKYSHHLPPTLHSTFFAEQNVLTNVPAGHPACLDAFTVALNESCDGTQWYASTMELQLASLGFCKACRSVSTLRLTVEKATPARLWNDAAAHTISAALKRPKATRVPVLQPRDVTWKLPAGSMKDVARVFEKMRGLTLGDLVMDTVDGVSWPASLRSLTFGRRYNRSVDGVLWPTSVECVTFGDCFNNPIQDVTWPTRLLKLTFGEKFNQAIAGVSWPPLLRTLVFGKRFNQPVREVRWPARLQQLVLGDRWDGFFDQAIQGSSFPASLEHLSFAAAFNQPIDAVAWPASLQGIRFDGKFNQPIAGVYRPTSVKRLSFGVFFNQAISSACWPASLE